MTTMCVNLLYLTMIFPVVPMVSPTTINLMLRHVVALMEVVANAGCAARPANVDYIFWLMLYTFLVLLISLMPLLMVMGLVTYLYNSRNSCYRRCSTRWRW